MTLIVLNKVIDNAGNSVPIELHRDNVKAIEPKFVNTAQGAMTERRRVGAQSRVYTGIPGLAYVDVLETAATIRQLCRPTPNGEMIGGEQRHFPALDVDMVSTEGLALVDTRERL